MLFPKGTSHNQQSFVVEKAQAFSCTPWEKLTQATNEIHRPPTIHGQPGLSLPSPPPYCARLVARFLYARFSPRFLAGAQKPATYRGDIVCTKYKTKIEIKVPPQHNTDGQEN